MQTSQLRRADDCFVDELLAPANVLGVPLLAARFARTYLDLNRDPGELDPSIFAQAPPYEQRQSSDRVAAGLGVMPRIVAQGVEIYDRKLDLTEAAQRIAAAHTPYHEQLAALLGRALGRHGFAVLLDCHSMPTPQKGTGMSPQFVLGDLFGRSAAPELVDHLESALHARGFRVARNAPYAGGYTTEWHADPRNGIHVVQLEIDRAIYMDQRTLRRHSGFAMLSQLLAELVKGLLAFLATVDLRGAPRLAAE